MANDFNASVVISTKESETGIRALDSAAKDLDKTLRNLDGALKGAQGNLDTVSKSMTELTRANTALIKSEQDRAKATVLAAKADGQMIVNEGKRAKTTRDNDIAAAKSAKIRQSTVAAGLTASANLTRRDAESRARIAGNDALSQQRVASETARTTTALINQGAATTRATIASNNLASQSTRLASGQRSAQSGTLALNDSLSNSRYLLYDVGQTYTVLASALQVIPIATAAVAIAYEKDFAQVIRTNDTLAQGNGFSVLRDDLKQLATQIPLTFSEFSNIATIGGQLGIQGKNIESFTETVARFGAASDVSLDQASTAFGRFQNSFDPQRLDPDFFNKIGSAVAFVGVKSAATESEIIAVSNQISAAGAQFGFAADEVVGLSGALASVRIRPELARGAFQRIMLGLSRAADEGSDSFQKFGKYTGLAAEESMALFKNDPSKFFHLYVGGIKDAIAQTGSVSSVLDDIGAKNVFDKQFLLGLANGYDTFTDALNNSSKAFGEGSFLNESTQGIFDTMDAKLKRIANSFKNIGDTVGKGSLQGLSGVADTVLGITNAADRLLKAAPGITLVINAFLGLGSVIGLLLAFKAAQAFMLAGMVGFQQVLGKGTLAAGLTARGILQQVAVTMLMAKGASQAHAQALVAQAGAFKAMGVAAQTSAAQVRAGTLAGIGGVSNAAPVATNALRGMTGALGGVARGALGLVGGPIGAAILGIGALGIAFVQAEEKANSAGDAIARAMQNGADAGKRAIAEQLTARTVDSWITDQNSGGIGNHGKNVRELAAQVGISFNSIVNAISKGDGAAKEFNKVLDEAAKKRGFTDYADLQNNSFSHLQNNSGELSYLNGVVEQLGQKSAESAKDVKAVEGSVADAGGAAAAATPDASGFADEIGNVGDEADTAAEKLDKFLNAIFGIVDASGATQAALQSLGEGLAGSSDFGPGTEGGRENIANFREALQAAATEQQMLIDTTGKSTQQASADYIAFVEGLVAQMVSHGVDPTNVTAMADQAKGYFGSALATGPQPTIQVQADPVAATNAALTAGQQVQSVLNGMPKPDVFIGANTATATGKAVQLAQSLAQITGYPYQVVLDALTDPAHEKSAEIYALITSITNKTYTAPIGADTSAAITNVRNFASYASQQLAAVQSAYNSVAASAPTLAKYTKPLFKGVTGATSNVPAGIARPSAPVSNASVAQIAAPTQVAPSAQPNFGALNDGYDKVKQAAEKAGDAGKKAGEDMANGIDDATEAANDYANRLKTGLTSAFDKQYGLQKATDDYYSALNAITKKREDELQQIDDLISKQKDLNNEAAEQMITANKAGIEKDISLKYGEVDRAADYAQQEQEALDAAAAKQKDIAANNAQIVSLKDGIDKFDGYSQAAIENREALRNLESKMLDMVVAYANTGASVEQVRAYSERLTGQFKTDANQVWQNRVQIDGLVGDLGRYIGTINAVPYYKPTTVSADVGGNGYGAIGNVQAFGSQADWAARPRTAVMTANITDLNAKMTSALKQYEAIFGSTGKSSGLFAAQNGGPGWAQGGLVTAPSMGFSSGGLVPGKAPSNLSKDNMMAKVDNKGLVGIQSEEFVMKKRAVDYWGTDFMNAINSMKMPAFSGGGQVGGRSAGAGSGGPLLVELTAENVAAILRLADRPIDLYAGVEKLASTVAEGQAILATKGVQ